MLISIIIKELLPTCFSLFLQLISKLAVVIFTALDHGLQDEEERHLSPDLVALLDAMAAAG